MLGIIVFIFITFFLLSKLNEILGMRMGFYVEKEKLRDNPSEAQIEETTVSEIDKKILEIKKLYPVFEEEDFLNKAEKAFEIIFKAYSEGDTKTLKNLMSPRIFQAFSLAIDDRKKRRETLEGILVRFISKEIVDISSTEEGIFVTVKFGTEQSNVLKSSTGKILEGNSDFVETRADIWSFFRNKSSSDPKWYLYEIKSE